MVSNPCNSIVLFLCFTTDLEQAIPCLRSHSLLLAIVLFYARVLLQIWNKHFHACDLISLFPARGSDFSFGFVAIWCYGVYAFYFHKFMAFSINLK